MLLWIGFIESGVIGYSLISREWLDVSPTLFGIRRMGSGK